jgi:hypothetical protein
LPEELATGWCRAWLPQAMAGVQKTPA